MGNNVPSDIMSNVEQQLGAQGVLQAGEPIPLTFNFTSEELGEINQDAVAFSVKFTPQGDPDTLPPGATPSIFSMRGRID